MPLAISEISDDLKSQVKVTESDSMTSWKLPLWAKCMRMHEFGASTQTAMTALRLLCWNEKRRKKAVYGFN